jgi:hypothetical protein
MDRKLLLMPILGIAFIHTNTALAQSLDGQYKALLHCEKLPFTKAPLKNEPVDLAISAGKVTYSRTLYGYDRKTVVGKEAGTGSVAADGTIEIIGGWQGRRDTLKASYRGNLSGGSAKLTGKHTMTFKGKTYDRACSMSLAR